MTSNQLDVSRPFPRSYWMEPGNLLAGFYPGSYKAQEAREKIQSLLDIRVTFFIDLTEEGELLPYQAVLAELADHRAVTYQRMPIPDLGIPTIHQMRRILNAIDRAISIGRVVYVHCWGGIGRTGTVVGCYLARHGHIGEQALRQIERLREVLPDLERQRVSPETPEQRAMILDWPESQ